jgi:hypothetical protein
MDERREVAPCYPSAMIAWAASRPVCAAPFM